MKKIMKWGFGLIVAGLLLQAGTGGIYLGSDQDTVKAKGADGALRNQTRVICKYIKLPKGMVEETKWPVGTDPETLLPRENGEIHKVAKNAIMGPEGCPKRWFWQR